MTVTVLCFAGFSRFLLHFADLKTESREIGSLSVRTTGPKVPPRRNAVSLSANYPAGKLLLFFLLPFLFFRPRFSFSFLHRHEFVKRARAPA